MAKSPAAVSPGPSYFSEDFSDSQIPSDILKDVVAYVEVRTANDNRSAAVKRVLERMGATVEDKFTNDVTHVIFKEGKKRTMEKAQKLGVHLLSVLWVDRCKELQQKVPESEFYANTERCSTPPPGVRWKKFRSMQPRDFEDEVARSTERLQKRRRKVNPQRLLQGMDSTTPYHASAAHVLVVDTQPRSPFDAVGLNFYSPVIIPNTPPSMQAKLDKLIREKEARRRGETESPLCHSGDAPLQRILFANHNSTAEEDSEMSTSGASLSPRKAPSVTRKTSVKLKESKIAPLKDSGRNRSSENCSFVMHSSSNCETSVAGLNTDYMTTRPTRQARCRQSLLPQSCSKSDEELSQSLSQTLQQSPSTSILSQRRTRHSVGHCLSRTILDPLEKCRGKNDSGTVSSRSKDSVEEKMSEILCEGVDKTGNSIKRNKKACSKNKSDGSSSSNPEISRPTENNHVSSWGTNVHLTPSTNDSKSTLVRTKRKLLNPCDNVHILAPLVAVSKPASGEDCKSQSGKRKRKSCDIDAIFPAISLPAAKRSRASGSVKYASVQRSSQSGLGRDRKADELPSNRRKKNLSASQHGKLQASNDESASVSDSTMETSMSMMFCDISKISSINKGLPPPRSSIAEFKPLKICWKKSRSSLRLASKWQVVNQEDQTCVASLQKSHLKSMPSIVMTSMHRPEQEAVIAAVKRLGTFRIEDKASRDTTHVVYGEPRRTLNLLHGLARGCWIVSKEWVTESSEAGKWLSEEDFEANDDIPKAKEARLLREAEPAGTYKCRIFESTGLLFISANCTPPRSQMLKLLNLCGAKVTDNKHRAEFYIGDQSDEEKICIKPVWVLDCISQLQLLPMEDYLLAVSAKPKSGSSPEY